MVRAISDRVQITTKMINSVGPMPAIGFSIVNEPDAQSGAFLPDIVHRREAKRECGVTFGGVPAGGSSDKMLPIRLEIKCTA
jgi:hypothetical protein